MNEYCNQILNKMKEIYRIDINKNNKEIINKTKKENKKTKFNNSIPHKNIILNKTQDIFPIKGAIRKEKKRY